MIRNIATLFAIFFLNITAYAQTEFTEKFNNYNEVSETNNPNYSSYAELDGLWVIPVKWVPYDAKCRSCILLAENYNKTMQELFNIRGLLEHWLRVKYVIETQPENSPLPKQQTEEELAAAFSGAMLRSEIINPQIPALQAAREQLELSANNMMRALDDCERTCVQPENQKNLIS